MSTCRETSHDVVRDFGNGAKTILVDRSQRQRDAAIHAKQMSRRSDARRGYRNKDSLRGTGFERFAMGGMPQDHAGKIAPWRRGPRPEARNPDQHIEACISKRMLCGISDRLVVEAVPTQRRAYRQSAEPCEHLVRRIRPFATAE